MTKLMHRVHYTKWNDETQKPQIYTVLFDDKQTALFFVRMMKQEYSNTASLNNWTWEVTIEE